MTDLIIRIEQPEDAPSIDSLLQAVFPTANEARLVNALRQRAKPYLGLVAESREGVIAHCLLTPVTSDSKPDAKLWGLGPMAVAPGLQRQGIGTRLMRGTLSAARDTGAGAVFVLGHQDFYPRFGFENAAEKSIQCTWDVQEGAFMVLPLQKQGLDSVTGLVRYHEAFDNA